MDIKEYANEVIDSLKKQAEIWKDCPTEYGKGAQYAYEKAAEHAERLLAIALRTYKEDK